MVVNRYPSRVEYPVRIVFGEVVDVGVYKTTYDVEGAVRKHWLGCMIR